MEKLFRDLFRKIDIKKVSIEQEYIEGGCIAVPSHVISIEHNGKVFSVKTVDIEEGLEDLLSKLEE